jgi:hypothetical protein
MMRFASLFAGTVVVLAAYLALGQEHRDPPGCHDGHPMRRINATYGGMHGVHGYQRDHVVPLGLLGPDTASNVKLQRCDKYGTIGKCLAGPAADKDNDEDEAIEKYCSGRWDLDYARAWLANRWPTDKEHGYDFQ